MLRKIFPDLDVDQIRVRRGCRLPANRFDKSGSTYAMTFGYSIYWRDEVLDEDDPVDLVKMIHEVMHVEQTRRLGGEAEFACAYGEGYLEGGATSRRGSRIRPPTTSIRSRPRRTRSNHSSATNTAGSCPNVCPDVGLRHPIELGQRTAVHEP